MRLPLAIAALALAVAACSGDPAPATPSPSPTPSTDPVNVAACQHFAKAADQLAAMAKQIGPGDANGSMIVAMSAKMALEDMSGGSRLARGEVQAAMERAVAAVQIIQSGAAGSPDGRVSMANEIQAARLTLAEVVRTCRAAGADTTIDI